MGGDGLAELDPRRCACFRLDRGDWRCQDTRRTYGECVDCGELTRRPGSWPPDRSALHQPPGSLRKLSGL
jgi:hypothetical protein